jgi:heterodisulfide reductase subunit C
MVVEPFLVDDVRAAGAFDAEACMNCGVCTATCPLGLAHLPRELFRYVLLGLTEEVRAHTDTVYSCLLCRMCEENCPAGVHITENVRTLRHYFDRKVFRL